MTDEEKLRANATLTVEMLGPISQIDDFGLNRHSLVWLEGFIERQRRRPDLSADARKGFVRNLGAYLGECIIACHGGDWSRTEQGWAVAFGPTRAVFPFSKLSKLMEYGVDDGESIVAFFDAVPLLMDPQAFPYP